MSDYFCVGPYSMLSRVDNVRSTAALATGLLNNNSFCNKAADKGDEQLLLTTTDCHHQHHTYHRWCHGAGKFSCCAWVLRPSWLLISAPCLAEASKLPGGGFGASFAVHSDMYQSDYLRLRVCVACTFHPSDLWGLALSLAVSARLRRVLSWLGVVCERR